MAEFTIELVHSYGGDVWHLKDDGAWVLSLDAEELHELTQAAIVADGQRQGLRRVRGTDATQATVEEAETGAPVAVGEALLEVLAWLQHRPEEQAADQLIGCDVSRLVWLLAGMNAQYLEALTEIAAWWALQQSGEGHAEDPREP